MDLCNKILDFLTENQGYQIFARELRAYAFTNRNDDDQKI